MAVRKLIVAENMTANGVLDRLGSWFHPGEQEDAELLAVQHEHMATEDALILGRQTFEDFRGYWPHQVDDRTGFTAHLNAVQKHVVSRTLDDPGWENTTVLRGPLEERVRDLKAQEGGDIGITGSVQVVHALMRAGLVDAYRLFVYPTVVADGRNLVPAGMEVQPLELVETRSFPSGVVLLEYNRL